jgi:hypothetical protein
MAVETRSKIQYKPATPEGTRYQADPPHCNLCEQVITRVNFGHAYLTTEGKVPVGDFEFIECTACTVIRENGPALLTFLERHKL